jgi:hypothetical protein
MSKSTKTINSFVKKPAVLITRKSDTKYKLNDGKDDILKIYKLISLTKRIMNGIIITK